MNEPPMIFDHILAQGVDTILVYKHFYQDNSLLQANMMAGFVVS
jgi:hypothetical protein